MPLSPRLLGIALVTALIGMIAGCVVCYQFNFRAHEQPGFAKTHRGHLARLDRSSQPGRVVFLGSSTFQGLDVSSVTPFGLSLSLGGDTLPSMLMRASGYESIKQARSVVINIGLNDIIQNCAVPYGQVKRIVDLVPADIPVIILGVQEVVSSSNKFLWCDGRVNDLVAELNREFERICLSEPRCRFVVHPVTTNRMLGAKDTFFDSDGVHLSPDGYKVLIESLKKALAEMDSEAVSDE